MSKSKATPGLGFEIELTGNGVFQKAITSSGVVKRKQIAKPIRLRAIGLREGDDVTVAQIQFKSMHGEYRTEFFDWSNLLPEGRHEIKRRLADLGYEWPENDRLSKAILRTVAKSRPTKQFKLVRAPGWYESVFVIPGKVFAPDDDKTEVYIDSNSDAHVGAFVRGEGSLGDWKKYVAEHSTRRGWIRR